MSNLLIYLVRYKICNCEPICKCYYWYELVFHSLAFLFIYLLRDCCICISGDELAASVAQIQISPPKPSTTGGNGKSGGVFPIPERQIIADKQNQVGKRGRPIEIEVNHLLLGLKKSGLAIHYDCSFKPDVPKKMLR